MGLQPLESTGRHRYFFRLYAVDAPLSLTAGATKQDMLKAVKGHELAVGELMGTCEPR